MLIEWQPCADRRETEVAQPSPNWMSKVEKRTLLLNRSAKC
jgi:hypothetical protein